MTTLRLWKQLHLCNNQGEYAMKYKKRLVGIKLLSCCSEITLMGRGISAQVAPAQAVRTNGSGQTMSQRLRNCKSAPPYKLTATENWFLPFLFPIISFGFNERSLCRCQCWHLPFGAATGGGAAATPGLRAGERWRGAEVSTAEVETWGFSQLNCGATINIFFWDPCSLHSNCAFSETVAACTTPESDLKVLCSLFFLRKYISFIYLST